MVGLEVCLCRGGYIGLENETCVEDQGVVIGVKVCCGDLLADPKDKSKAASGIVLQLQRTDHQSGADEILHPTIIGPAVEKHSIVFDFRPENSTYSVLPDHVPRNWSPDSIGICGGQYCTNARQDLEILISLAGMQSRRQIGMVSAILIGASGKGASQ